MRIGLTATSLLALVAALASGAQVAHAAGNSTLGLRLGSDHLSGGRADWEESALQFSHRFGKRQSLDLEVLRTERFGLRDRAWRADYAHPLSESLTLNLEAGASPTHRVLAEHSVGAGLQYEFRPAWLLHGGARSTRYESGRVNQGLLMLEHYVDNYGLAAGWRPARTSGTDAHVGELRVHRYYGERNAIGLIFAAGREAENVAGTVLVTSVRSLALTGRHWFTPDWALSYGLNHTRQGALYNRNGIQLGLHHAF